MSHPACRPIFIIGCPRSGTTLLRLMLDSHPHISCGPESHFLTDLAGIVDRHGARIGRFGVDRDQWYEKTAHFFHAFHMAYAQKRGKQRWAEKTPKYTRHLALVNQLFPDCQLIHMIRNGRDVVSSYHQRWGYLSAVKTAAYRWREYITLARDFGKTLPKDRYFELGYEDLVNDTEMTLRGMFEFLQEPWVPDVLNYQDAPHDVNDLYATSTQAFRSESAGVVYTSRMDKNVDPFLKTVMRVGSGRLLQELGY
ncbi:sulfotransferase family protein [Candidatus Entotheonella palauensis]|uniref:Sulfotransferase n=1 Tax=Candidatus Entotheonella gemina TaxID=1429439 RepID=W4MDF8_9BACT|nr:sulfotransferase [Candidatus Entotheonella palauensis]ETX08359.1 MAG: hypothetical protein ETSY2_05855 [Candidatus Entotheonella gemina]